MSALLFLTGINFGLSFDFAGVIIYYYVEYTVVELLWITYVPGLSVSEVGAPLLYVVYYLYSTE